MEYKLLATIPIESGVGIIVQELEENVIDRKITKRLVKEGIVEAKFFYDDDVKYVYFMVYEGFILGFDIRMLNHLIKRVESNYPVVRIYIIVGDGLYTDEFYDLKISRDFLLKVQAFVEYYGFFVSGKIVEIPVNRSSNLENFLEKSSLKEQDDLPKLSDDSLERNSKHNSM